MVSKSRRGCRLPWCSSHSFLASIFALHKSGSKTAMCSHQNRSQQPPSSLLGEKAVRAAHLDARLHVVSSMAPVHSITYILKLFFVVCDLHQILLHPAKTKQENASPLPPNLHTSTPRIFNASTSFFSRLPRHSLTPHSTAQEYPLLLCSPIEASHFLLRA